VIKLTGVSHPITAGVDANWPALLGFQRLVAKPDADVLATIDGWPLLVAGRFGKGRSLAFASDIAPHWAPQEFLDWPGYARLWGQAVGWLTAQEG